MSYASRLMPVLVVALALLAATAQTGRAAAAAGPAAYPDATGDAASAPDITGVTLTPSADGSSIVVDVALATVQDLADGSALVVLIDSDRNTATGNTAGIDYAALLTAQGSLLGRFNGETLGEFAHQPLNSSLANGHATFTLTLGDLGGSQAFAFVVASVHGNDLDTVGSGALLYPQDATPAPAPTPVPAPAPAPVVTVTGLIAPGPVLAPKAGRVYRVNGVQVRLSDDSFVVPETVRCRLTLKGAALKPVGPCAYRLPLKLKGKSLRLRITVTYHGETAAQTLPVRVS
jgi:hypothetical protein